MGAKRFRESGQVVTVCRRAQDFVFTRYHNDISDPVLGQLESLASC